MHCELPYLKHTVPGAGAAPGAGSGVESQPGASVLHERSPGGCCSMWWPALPT